MKRGNDVVKKGFTISDESDIPDALSPLLGKVLWILRKG